MTLLLPLLLVLAQEMAVPDTPVPSTITSYKIVGFSQEREPDWRFTITYKDSNNMVYRDEHYGLTTLTGPDGKPITRPEGADELMKQLNTGNFSTTSMVKRLLQHLVQHGKIPPSTVQGTPEIAVAITPSQVNPTSITTGRIPADSIHATKCQAIEGGKCWSELMCSWECTRDGTSCACFRVSK
jgi:hypothetical protein